MEDLQKLGDFFAYMSIEDAKNRLKDLLDITVTGSFNKELSCRERCDLVYFVRELEKVIDAASGIYKSANQ